VNEITNKRIILIALAFSLFSLAFFLFYEQERPIDELLVVAKFTKINRDVKRKMASSLDWGNVVENEQILTNDLIYTGTNSSTVIVYLSKKLKFLMPANTIIRIEMVKNSPVINVEKGKLNIEIGEKVDFTVQRKDEKLDVKGEVSTSIHIPDQGALTASSLVKSNVSNSENDKDEDDIDKDITFEGQEDYNLPSPISKPHSMEKLSVEEQEAINNQKRKKQTLGFYSLIFFSGIILITSFFI
jgi:hypothetical protein